jgi:hypothetical protein
MMYDLIVLVPSRGRPNQAKQLIDSFHDTCRAKTLLMFVVDSDDPTLQDYVLAVWGHTEIAQVMQIDNTAHTMVHALNRAAEFVAGSLSPRPYAIGFMGDDHRPRTTGWDELYLSELRRDGCCLVYGDDLWQGQNLPTQVAMRTDVVSVVGYMAPPGLKHMYVDNFWRDLGNASGTLTYHPDVKIEHMHPVAGKAEWTEGHQRVNAQAIYDHDAQAYAEYQETDFPGAVNRVRTLVRSPLGSFAPQPSTRGGYVTESVPDTEGEHEWRLFEAGTIPEFTTPEWYEGREHVPHLNQTLHRDRLHMTATFVAQAVLQSRLNTVVDLGAGDGGLLTLLGPRIEAWGYDLMTTNIEAAKLRGVDVQYGDVVAGDIEWGSIAVCTEMLEHLVDPHGFAATIRDHAQYLVCSSPWNERRGNAYAYHAWAWDIEGYRNMLQGAGWKVLRQRKVHSFQVILAVRS